MEEDDDDWGDDVREGGESLFFYTTCHFSC